MNTATAGRNADARPVDRLIAEYSDSHQNMTNRVIHWVCVPVIYFSSLGLAWVASPYVVVAFMVLSMLYYLRLSVPLAIGMALCNAACLWLLPLTPYLLYTSIGLFIAAWIVQFVGHKIEGKKPSFFKDIFFLLIGPIYLLHFIYRRLGIRY
jgi:uncharacterized membrane protein YGL010W